MKQMLKKFKTGRALSAFLAVVLTLSVLLSSFVGMPISAKDSDNSGIDPSIIWDGSANTQAATEGTGTEADPYIIKTAKEFYHYMYWGYSVTNDLYLKLDTDIYLNAPGTFDPATGEVADGKNVNTWSAKKFRGTIDGNGHTIYGLYTNENPTEYSRETSYYGLFSQPVAGRSITIKNLGIDDVYINANGVAAAFVAFSNNSTGRVKISNSYVGENVTIIARSAGAFISWGSFTKPAEGEENFIVLDSCYSLATLEAHGKSASLVGSIWSGWYTISKCYATHDIAGAATSNCYSTTQGTAGSTAVALVVDADIKGANALEAMPNLGDAFVATIKYPALKIFPYKEVPAQVDPTIIWDGTENTEGATEGTGYEGDPYIIKTAKQFYHYMKWGYSTGRNMYLKLDTDIYLNAPGTFDPETGEVLGDKVNTWSAKQFQGEIDGNGHTIYGLYTNENPTEYTSESNYYGLLSKPVTGTSITIKNLGIDDVYINANGVAAAFVAYTSSSTGRVYITNSYVGENVTIKARAAGAFIAWGGFTANDASGNAYLEVTQCYSLATLEGNGKGASLIGAVWSGYYRIVENYATHDIFVNSGGSIARNYSTTQATTSYYVTKVADADIKGAGALSKMPDLAKLGEVFVETDSYPTLAVFASKLDDSETPGGDGSGGDGSDGDDSVIDPSIIWDGSANTQAATEGSGTEADPYIIKTAKEFYHYMYWGYSVTSDLYLKLDTDIYLNAPGTFDPATGAVTGDKVNTWSAKQFRGTIDGNGHTIYGLYTNENPTDYSSESNYYGLLSKPVTGTSITIKNLGIDDVYINANGVAAAFVAFSNNSTGRVKISNSYVGENVTIIAKSAGAFISWGSFTKPSEGDNYIVIDSCYSLATLEAHGKSASLVGSIWSGWYTISKCYATHDIAGAGTSNCYSTTQGTAGSTSVALVAEADMQGQYAFVNMPNLGDAFALTAGFPALKVFPHVAIEAPDVEDPDGPGSGGEDPDGPGSDDEEPEMPEVPQVDPSIVWDGSENTQAAAEGSGTQADPYIIKTAKEFYHYMKWGYSVTSDLYLKLDTDIYLNAPGTFNPATGKVVKGKTVNTWSAKKFRGTIDGNGHTIYGLYINENPSSYGDTYTYYGLFSQPVSGRSITIKNLGIDDVYINANGSAAAFVAYAGNSIGRVKFENSYVGENVTIKATSAGAFVSWGAFNKPGEGEENFIVLDSCYSLATLEANGKSASLLGSAWGGWYTINRCYATHNIPSEGAENSYSATSGKSGSDGLALISKENMKGSAALYYMPNLGDKFAAAKDTYPALKMFPYEPAPAPDFSSITVWDGELIIPTEKGTGKSIEDPILIENPAQFVYVMKNGGNGLYYKLTTDVYLNKEGTFNNDGTVNEGFKLNVWNPKNFSGTIDGDGHVIYGVYINDNPTQYTDERTRTGLIAQADGDVTITNLGIDNVYINADKPVAAFIGSAGSSVGKVKFSNSYVGKNVTLKGVATGAFIAWGLYSKPDAGEDNPLVIDTCYSLATLLPQKVEHKEKDFLYGGAWGGWYTVSNCYATHKIADAGVSNCYSTVQSLGSSVAKVNDADIKGANALANMPKLTNAFVVSDSYPVLFVFTPEASIKEGDIWSGRVAIRFEKGTGDKNNPFIISNGAELALAVTSANYKGKYFKITKDIYLNDVSVDGWETLSTNNTWVNAAGFDGHLDGDGHIVYGIWFPNDTKNQTSALISYFNKGTIEKLGVRKSFINATHQAGGIVAVTRKGGTKVIDQCFVDETVRIEYTIGSGGIACGGIVGYAETDSSATEAVLTISNCYSKAVLVSFYDQAFRANGIIGTAWKCSYVIKNCYSYGEPPMAADSAGNTSYLYKGEDNVTVIRPMDKIITNLYTDKRTTLNEFEHFTTIATENMRGNNALTYMPGLDYTNIFEVVANGTPKLRVFAGLDGTDIAVERNNLYASGTGTKDDPYIIKTAFHLTNLVKATDTKGKYYSLANDIYINDVSDPNWTNNNPNKWRSGAASTAFAGTFEGNGYTVYGIYNNDTPKEYIDESKFKPSFIGNGLFPSATGDAVIRNVHVRSSYIAGRGYVGSIVGYASVGSNGRARIVGCSADETVKLSGESVGGIVGGGGKGVVLNYCYFTGEILYATPNRANGMVGDIWNNNQEVSQCYSVGYTNYRTIPSYIEALYGTKTNTGTTVLTKEQMTGSEAKNYMTQFNWDVWQIVEGKTPQLRVVKQEEEISFTYNGEVGKPWSGQFAPGFAGGSGTEADPYLIETPEQLAYLIGAYYSKAGEHYKITADIIINDTSYQGWEKDAINWFADYLVFRGHLDGDGHIISGLYYNGSGGGRAALIPVIGQNASVKRLGIVNSTINNPLASGTQGYAAAFIGYIHHWMENPKEGDVAPKISECFADHTVTITAQYAGGLIGGAPSPVHVENCYFTGTIIGEEYTGGLLGNSWMTKAYHKFKNSYVATADRNMIGQGAAFTGAGDETYKNVYVDGSKGQTVGVTALSLMYMKGHSASTYMEGFDFKNIWKTVSDGTPVLRCFANAEKYSCSREPGKIEISFATGDGSKCESIYGYPRYSEVPKLPTPTRYGYKFGGWYCFVECDVPFTERLFPDFNTVLYAKWIPVGFSNGFEGNLDSKYDYNAAAEHARPGVKGYLPTVVHTGLKAMHTLPDANEDALILLNYEDVLEVGKVYEVSYWVSAASDAQSGTLQFLHANHPQYNSDLVGYETILEFENLKKGQWTEYKYTFTANTPYLILKVSQGSDIYLDDVQFVLTDEEGELGLIKPIDSGAFGLSGKTILYIAIAAAVAAIVIAGAIVVTVIVRKKKRA